MTETVTAEMQGALAMIEALEYQLDVERALYRIGREVALSRLAITRNLMEQATDASGLGPDQSAAIIESIDHTLDIMENDMRALMEGADAHSALALAH